MSASNNANERLSWQPSAPAPRAFAEMLCAAVVVVTAQLGTETLLWGLVLVMVAAAAFFLLRQFQLIHAPSASFTALSLGDSP
jgi:hypothetical protein